MFRNMTLGQYYPADSILHRLDPRTKLFGTLIFIISIFIVDSVPGMLVIAAFLGAVIIISKVPFSFMVKGIKGIVVLLMIAGLFNLFLTPGDKILFHYGILTITDAGLKSATLMTIRMIVLIIGTSVMTLTTTPNSLTDGLEKGTSISHCFQGTCSRNFNDDVDSTSFLILIEETDKIMKAQMARGADFESGGIFQKAKSMVPILVPLFVSAFRRANDLALAMEARCYNGGDGRTNMKPLKYAGIDAVSYVCIFVFLGVCIAAKVLL